MCCAKGDRYLAHGQGAESGKKASLDALCDRFEINNKHRTLHGALLDAELLADVYLAMTRGQESLMMALDDEAADSGDETASAALVERPPLRILRASELELQAHAEVLDEIAKSSKGQCLWLGRSRLRQPERSRREARRDFLGDRQRGGESGRLDAEEVDPAGDAVRFGAVDAKVGGRLVWSRYFRPHTSVARYQATVAEARPVAADGCLEGVDFRIADVIVGFGEPFDVGAEAAWPARSRVSGTPSPPGSGSG